MSENLFTEQLLRTKTRFDSNNPYKLSPFLDPAEDRRRCDDALQAARRSVRSQRHGRGNEEFGGAPSKRIHGA